MVTEDYVSLETAKLLKEKGFRETCPYCYGLDVRHNGKYIDSDEEFELKSEGRENEIEYVDGGHFYHIWSNNSDDTYAAPTIQIAMKWLKDAHRIHFEIEPYTIVGKNDVYYNVKVLKQVFGDKYLFDGELVFKYLTNEFRLSYEQACEDAIKYCLENLI